MVESSNNMIELICRLVAYVCVYKIRYMFHLLLFMCFAYMYFVCVS